MTYDEKRTTNVFGEVLSLPQRNNALPNNDRQPLGD